LQTVILPVSLVSCCRMDWETSGEGQTHSCCKSR